MKQQNSIKIFEDKKVRTVWDPEQEKWFVSIIDVIEVLTDSDRPRKYWSDLKSKLKSINSVLEEAEELRELIKSKRRIIVGETEPKKHRTPKEKEEE